MKPYARRAALAQNARLYGSHNTPDRLCECGALDSKHDDHDDPFTDATKTCAKTECVGFVAIRCACKRCPAEFCKDGAVPVMEPIRFRNGEPSYWAHTGDWLPCIQCHGTGKDNRDCAIHDTLTAGELIAASPLVSHPVAVAEQDAMNRQTNAIIEALEGK